MMKLEIFNIEYKDPRFVSSFIEELVLTKSYNATSLSTITERFNIYNNYETYISSLGDFIEKQNYSVERIMHDLISFDLDLGGNGLNYRQGVNISYIDSNGNCQTYITKMNEITFNDYINNNNYDNGYVGRYINNPEYFPEQKLDPDNYYLVDETKNVEIVDTETQLSKTKNSTLIDKHFHLGNFKTFLFGLVLGGILGFIFGFLADFLSKIIIQRRKRYLLTKDFYLSEAKKSLRVGALSALFACVFSIVNISIITLITLIFKKRINSIMIQSILLYIYISVIFIMIIIKYKNRLKEKKIWYALILLISLLFVLSLPTLLFNGIFKYFGILLSLAISIFIRVYLVSKRDFFTTSS